MLAGVGIACVVLGRERCTQTRGVLNSDWSCSGSVHPDEWSDAGLEGQYAVAIGSLIIAAYFLVFGVLDCCGRRTGKIEAVLSLIGTLGLAVCSGAEFYYGIFFFDADVLGLQSTRTLVQSWIAAGVNSLSLLGVNLYHTPSPDCRRCTRWRRWRA